MKKSYKRLFQVMAISLFGTMSYGQFYIIGEGLQPMDVSVDGTVVGSQGGKNQWMWSPSQSIVNMGGLTTGNLIGNVVIADNGSRISGYMTNPQNNLNEMASYDKNSGSWTYHGGLGQSQDGLNSSTWGVSADGSTLVGYGILSNTVTRAIKWTTENGIENLGSLFPEKSTRANGISADKSVVVGFQDLASGQRAATFWKNGVQTVINNAQGTPTFGEANRVSADGKVIVGIDGIYPFVYTEESGYQSITHELSSNFYRGGAADVTADGKKVVGFFRNFPGSPYGGDGFIWSQTNGLINLNTYVSSFGIDLGNYTLALPLAISGDGTKIVGVARTPDFKTYGFMVDLTTYLATGNTSAKSDIKIYPNPVKDVLNITNAKNIKSVEVINMTGQKVASATTNQVNVSKLPKGNYIVRVTDATTSTTHKIVKE